MALLFSSLQLPPKCLRLSAPNRRLALKNPTSVPCLESKRRLLGASGVYDQRSMTELARIDGFGEKEDEVMLEAEAASSTQGFEWAEFESLLNRMSKWLIAFLSCLVIIWKHDAEVVWATMGSAVNSWLSITLKQVLNHERPASALRSDPGMPSSHAQCIFYTAVLGALSLFHWMGVNLFTVTVGAFIIAGGSYLTWLRVSQRLHTMSQVIVGSVLGSACATTWFWMWHAFVLRAFISSIWVQAIVVLGSATFCAAFLFFRFWLMDEQ